MMNDFRHAVRFLLRSPAFTLSALVVLSPAILLVVAALAASYLPVRWALRVDPMVALRRD